MNVTNDKYFYMVGDARRGPFSLEQMLDQPLHRDIPVWRKGMQDWTTAGEVPEIRDLVPPPPPTAASPAEPNVATNTAERRSDPVVQSINDRYAHALFVLNVGMAIFLLVAMLISAISSESFGILYWLEALTRFGLIGYSAAHARVRLPWLWAIGGLIPFVWLFVMLALHGKLSEPLRSAGYRISFFGRSAPARVVV